MVEDGRYKGRAQAIHVLDGATESLTPALPTDTTDALYRGIAPTVISNAHSPAQFDLDSYHGPVLSYATYSGKSQAIHVWGLDDPTWPVQPPVDACSCADYGYTGGGGGGTPFDTTIYPVGAGRLVIRESGTGNLYYSSNNYEFVATRWHPNYGFWTEYRTFMTWDLPEGTTSVTLTGLLVSGTNVAGTWHDVWGATPPYGADPMNAQTVQWQLCQGTWDTYTPEWDPMTTTVASGSGSQRIINYSNDPAPPDDYSAALDLTLPVGSGPFQLMLKIVTEDIGGVYHEWPPDGYPGNPDPWANGWDNGTTRVYGSALSVLTETYGTRVSMNANAFSAVVAHGTTPGGPVTDCTECDDPNNPGTPIPPFTPGYLPIFRRQIGDPTTRLDSYICTMESAAMVLDWHTRGAIQVWGGELIPWCGKSEEAIAGLVSGVPAGTGLDNARLAWAHWAQVLDVRSGQTWDDLMVALGQGRAIILEGDYGLFPAGESCQPGFVDNHSISLYPYLQGGRIMVGDPICTTFKGRKISTLQAYAEAYGASIFGTQSPQPIFFAVSRPWTP